jgi:cytochrome P450 family 110
VMDGARHREERQLLAPRLNAECVRGFGSAIWDIALAHMRTWRLGSAMSAYHAMLDISREVILYVLFGIRRGAIIDEAARKLEALLAAAHPVPSLEARLQTWWLPPWRSYLRAKAEFSGFVVRLLDGQRSGTIALRGILGHVVAARADGRYRVSDKEICEELITILLSGHETTAVALSWALYELARHPHVLTRLRDELDALGSDPAPDVLVKQPFLDAVCDETLRLHTILTEIGRISRVPCTLLGYSLPQGIGIGVGIGAIHQDPLLYPEPDAFRPGRFMEASYDAFEFLPYGGGHRRCLGAHLSDCEIRVVLAAIVTKLDFESLREDYDVRHSIGSGARYGIQMRFSQRREPMPAPMAFH